MTGLSLHLFHSLPALRGGRPDFAFLGGTKLIGVIPAAGSQQQSSV